MTLTTVEAEVAAAQRARFDATVAGDTAALGRLMADDLLYMHSTGRIDTKTSFIERLVENNFTYRGFEYDEPQVQVFGDAAYHSAVILLTQRAADGEHSHQSRCTSMWARRNGQWQEVLWQATRLPE